MTADDYFDPGYPTDQIGMENVPADVKSAIDAEISKAKSDGITRGELLEGLVGAAARGELALPFGNELLRGYLRQKIGAAIGSGRKTRVCMVQGRPVPLYVHYRNEDDEVRTVRCNFATLYVWGRSLDIKRDNAAAVVQSLEDDTAIFRYVEAMSNGDKSAFIFDYRDDDSAEEVAA